MTATTPAPTVRFPCGTPDKCQEWLAWFHEFRAEWMRTHERGEVA